MNQSTSCNHHNAKLLGSGCRSNEQLNHSFSLKSKLKGRKDFRKHCRFQSLQLNGSPSIYCSPSTGHLGSFKILESCKTFSLTNK